MKIFRYFTAILVSASFLAAGYAPTKAQVIQKELRRGATESPIRLDPQRAVLSVERAILDDLFAGLVLENEEGDIVPGAAESWEVNRDGQTYIFHLRPAQKWSDGQPLEARDFVYAFQRLLSSRSDSPYASLFYNIVGARALHRGETDDVRELGVKATTPQTLVFNLTRRSPEFLSQLLHQAAYPLRRDLVEKGDESWTRPGKMVSNGAFTLAEWLPGRYVRLAKNAGYFGAASVRLDSVYYYTYDDPAVGIETFFAGELDVLSGIPREQARDLFRTAPGAMRMYPTLTVDYLVFNTRKPPLDDPRVREALALAIDSPTLVREALDGGEMAASRFLPDGLANLREPAKVQRPGPYPVPRPFSATEKIELAKDILTDAGHGAQDSIRLTLHYNVGETHEKIATAIAGMWKKIGIRTEFYSSDYMVHYGDLAAGDFDVARAGWIADYDDPFAFLTLFQSKTERFNYGGFADEEFDRLLAISATQDPPTRAVTLYRAAQRAASLYPVVPLYRHASRNLVGQRVIGWTNNLRDAHPSRDLDVAGE